MVGVDPSNDGLKEMLQSAVQSVQWTYVIYWQFCSQQGVLEWKDGYYNGSIKTRKTVQPMEVSTEEAALNRSEQLRQLYVSLAAGDQLVMENNQQPTIRRPSVALSPEDLTESEWFYLMCVSFSFPPGVGLVGEAYLKQQHLWLSGAHETDSKVFTRAILAKSAHIQTVTCIPLLNGVVELGTTKKVEETIEFIRHVKLFFVLDNNNLILPSPKQTHSAHSSNTTLSPHQLTTSSKPFDNVYSMEEDVANEDDEEENEEEDEGFEDEDENENGSDFLKETCHLSGFQEPQKDKAPMLPVIETNELLHLDMSQNIRFGSPNDGSSNLDYRFKLLDRSHNDSFRDELTPRWSDNLEMQNLSTVRLQISETLQPQELANEDAHYSNTVSTILNNQSAHEWHNSTRNHNSLYTTHSSFAPWIPNHPKYQHLPTKTTSNSQKVLKYILLNVPFLHANLKSVGLRKTASHEELSANHVLAERRRREKLNERFIVLRSLVPLVTKMDKASILGDTIEYVKQLRKKIQDLESDGCHDGLDRSKRKIRVVNGKVKGATTVQVDVSIIESDALVEMQCVHRDGLLLDVMKKLRELGVEITTVQSSVEGIMCSVEMRAKVKGKANNRKKVSIMQVKKAINQIISPLH